MDQLPHAGVLAAQHVELLPGGSRLGRSQDGADGGVAGQGQPDRVERLRPLIRR